MEAQSGHELSFKELPTREQKIRRNKARRDSPTLPPIRLRLKSCTSPLHEPDADRSLSDRSVSSSPEAISLHLSPTSTFNCYNKYPRADPLSSPPVIVAEASNASNQCCDDRANNGDDGIDDVDEPLDMSTKRSHDTATVAAKAHNTTDSLRQQQQQQRPSVITCASALLRTQCNLADVSHHICSVAVADAKTCEESHAGMNSDSNDNSNQDVLRPGHRREIVSGSCDPVIDEHFRRSLGKDYQQIFSKSSSNSVSITVDDHFAKALGDTWLQLQQSSKSVDTDGSQQTPSQALHSKPFLQHSPEIVST